jgi:hypothetical protein
MLSTLSARRRRLHLPKEFIRFFGSTGLNFCLGEINGGVDILEMDDDKRTSAGTEAEPQKTAQKH